MKRALVADDNAVSQRLLAGLLSKLGYQSDVVSDGRAAVRALAQRAYDLILMDCEMPTVNGREATVAIRLREVDGMLVHTPIIAVTAFADRFSRDECKTAGMDGFLEKPVSLEALREEIDRVIPPDQSNREVLLAGGSAADR